VRCNVIIGLMGFYGFHRGEAQGEVVELESRDVIIAPFDSD